MNPLTCTTDARGVATLCLNTPERHNVLSADMIAALREAAATLGANPAVRVVVLTGRGESFCAGGDLKWMRAQFEAEPALRSQEARKLADMLEALNTMPKPLIGRIQGQAFGGGVGLMSVCDVAIGVEGARFGLTETRLGLIPATIGPYVVARMGEGPARRVFLSSRKFAAEEAQDLGLLARVVAPEDLDTAVEAEIAPYLSCAPGAVGAAKALALRLGAHITEEQIALSVDALVRQWETDEAQEGVAAFFAKEPAPWVKS